MTTSDEAVEVLRAVVQVARTLQAIAEDMRRRPDVTSVKEVCWMQPQQHKDEPGVSYGVGDGFGVEWYADGVNRPGLCGDSAGWIRAGLQTHGGQERGPRARLGGGPRRVPSRGR